MTGRAKRCAAWVLLGAAASPPLWAKDDPIEFARRLARRRYFDLAQEMVNQVEKDTRLSAAEKEAIPFARAEVLLEQAQAETDLKKARDTIDASVKLLKDFIRDHAKHPLAQEAQINIGVLQNQKAKRLSLALRVADDAARREELLRDARQTYGEVETYYRDLLNVYKAKDLENPENGYPYMDAIIEMTRTQLEHARLTGLDGDERNRILNDALKTLTEFLFEWGQTGKAFEAMWIAGQCYGDLGTVDRAESYLLQASVGLFKKLKDAGKEQDDYYLGIIRGATLSLAQLFTRIGKQKEAIAAIDEAFARDKGLERDPLGPEFKLEKAEALFTSGNAVQAKALNAAVLKSDPDGYWGYRARQQSKRWVSNPKAKISPEDLMNAAEASLDKDQWVPAIQSLRRCIELSVSPDEKKKFAVSASYKIGHCWLKLGRSYEAACAFETVYTQYPESEFAPKACIEAIRCYANEFNVSGDKRDEDAKDRVTAVMLQKWRDRPEARNLALVRADKIEKDARDADRQANRAEKPDEKAKFSKQAADLFHQAADLYLQVPADAEAYETSLLMGGNCQLKEGLSKWAVDSKSDASKAAVKTCLLKAEETYKKLLARLNDPKVPAPTEPDLKKRREDLRFFSTRQLANVYKHEAVARHEDCVRFLDDCAKALPPADERLGRILGEKVQSLIALKRLREAVQVVDMMFERYPDSPALPPAAKSVGIALDRATQELIDAKKGDPATEATLRENMKKVSQYYLKWVTDGPTAGMRVTVQEVAQVADRLFLNARRLNGIPDTVVSFLDLKGRVVKDRRPFQEAAFVHALLVEGKVGNPTEKEKIEMMTRLARCYSFFAANAQDWLKAKAQYNDIVETFKLVGKTGTLNGGVLQQHPELLRLYLELGHTFCELGRAGQKFQYENAMTVFANVAQVAPPQSELWWFGKYMLLAILFERGNPQDITSAKIGLKNLGDNYPGYDEGKFGMKQRFLDLKQKMDAVAGSK